MPFQAAVNGPSSAPSQAVMRVDPAQVLRLKQELEDIRDEAKDFITYEGAGMKLSPMGADPVSQDVSDTVVRNAETAIACMQGYIAQLNAVINSLAQAVQQYGLVDDNTADAFRKPGA